MAGLKAFREAFLHADLLQDEDFADFENRQQRYLIYWAFFENTAYRNFHSWAVAYRTAYGLYKWTRGVYNPAYRLGSFWQGHLMGGRLDPAAGDGEETPTALPIETDNDAVRIALASLWADSNWAIAKDIYTLYGSVLGDIGLQVVDDVERGQVYLKVVHPGIIKDVDLDDRGNVKGYEFEETRLDPEDKSEQRTVTYNETARRDGDFVVYETTRNGKPYPWNPAVGPTWREPYGFVPLVMTQHFNVGLPWGWAEIHAGRAKIHEVDDLASKVSDQIRKQVDPVWLFAGVKKPAKTPTVESTDQTTDRPEPEREDTKALYAPDNPQANAQPIVTNLSLPDALAHVRGILEGLEEDYPELKKKALEETGASGRAIRIARQETEAKVIHRREGYDDGFRRACQMAISIGGFREYDGYSGFGLDSFDRGDMEFSVGERPVFNLDPLDRWEIEDAFFEAAKKAVESGVPIETFLRRNGWNDEDLAEMGTARLAAIRLQQEDVIPEVEQ